MVGSQIGGGPSSNFCSFIVLRRLYFSQFFNLSNCYLEYAIFQEDTMSKSQRKVFIDKAEPKREANILNITGDLVNKINFGLK